MIDKKYERLSKGVVAEYRRLVTPFFYIRLKTRTYKYYERKSMFMLGMMLPKGHYYHLKGWEDEKLKHVYDDKLKKRLELANDQESNNVLKLRA